MHKSGVRAYRQRRYRSLDQRWVNWREQRIMTQLLSENRLAGGSLLDVPCGYGRFTALCTRLGITTIGADVKFDMLRLATETHPDYRWVRANILQLPFADGAVDGVICIRLFHHRFSSAERQQMLRELARVARRVVLLSFYCRTPLHAASRYWRSHRHRLTMLSRAEFHDLIAACGLRIQSYRSLLPGWHAQTFVVLGKDPLDASETGAPP
jgi:ubiquinone/menaquinone biosynthesis C-methylase UbiE